jgi:hypothetical protein
MIKFSSLLFYTALPFKDPCRFEKHPRQHVSVVGAEDIDNLCFRLETWSAGNRYVGPDAANDDDWVDRVYKVLQENWPNPKTSYIDVF